MNGDSEETEQGDRRRCPYCHGQVTVSHAVCPWCRTLIRIRGATARVLSEPSHFRRQPTADAFKGGLRCLARKRWADAVDQFGICVARVPYNVRYRQYLRGCEYELHSNDGVGEVWSDRKRETLDGELRQAMLNAEWDSADKLTERGLRAKPWDFDWNHTLGLACLRREYWGVAQYAFDCALQSDPGRDDIRQLIEELDEHRDGLDGLVC